MFNICRLDAVPFKASKFATESEHYLNLGLADRNEGSSLIQVEAILDSTFYVFGRLSEQLLCRPVVNWA
jgi:hypothetical protein